MSELGFQVVSVPGIKGCATTVFIECLENPAGVHSLPNSGKLMNPVKVSDSKVTSVFLSAAFGISGVVVLHSISELPEACFYST